MSNSESSQQQGSRDERPFPSRRQRQGSRIPLVDSPVPSAQKMTQDNSEPGNTENSDSGEPRVVPESQNAAMPLPTRSSRHQKKQIVTNSVEDVSLTDARTPDSKPKVSAAQPKFSRPNPDPRISEDTGTGSNFARRNPQSQPTSSSPSRLASEPHAAVLAQRRKARRRKKTFSAIFLIVLIILVLAGIWWAVNSVRGGGPQSLFESNDYPGPGSETVQITVSPGDLGSDIARSLYEADVVKSVEAFNAAFNANSASATILPGTYTLKKQMSAAGALAALLDEANRQSNSVTVTPGQTVTQIQERLVGVAGFTEDEVSAALADTAALGLPAVAGGNLEGWLAAGTYEVTVGSSPAVVLSEMVAKTVALQQQLGVPDDQWQITLIKASILEREVSTHTDLPKVARVIENRLSKPDAETVGLLQMDSTVLYGVGKVGGIPTAEDLASDSPFNTYRVKGLPPAPIATPSVEAIEATLNPADGDWLYFVTVDLDTGETLFASTLEEQMANQVLLDQWCTANEGRC